MLREIGKLEAKVDALVEAFEAHKHDTEERLRNIEASNQRVEGAIRILIWLGGIVATVAAAGAWLAEKFHWIK